MNLHSFSRSALFCGLVTVFISYAECLMFHLPGNAQKCLREELRQNVLIAGEYDVTEIAGQRVDYVVCAKSNSFIIVDSLVDLIN